MTENPKISTKEKELLNIMGTDASLSHKEIMNLTGYKREEIVSKKIKKLRDLDILRGPYCDVNLGALGSNQLFTVYADIMHDPEDRDLVFTLLKAVPGVRWIFPVLQGDRFFTQFQCNHFSITGRLLTFLKKKRVLTYELAVSQHRWINVNPSFFGPPIPDSKTLLAPCELPDLSYTPVKPKVRWNEADLTFMQYLQAETDSKTRIQDLEYRRYGKSWKYEQIKHSVAKIESSGVIQSRCFHISPYPRGKCCTFILQIGAVQRRMLLTLLHNFGGGCRIYKSYTMAGNYGFLFCWASTEIIPRLAALIDAVDGVSLKKVYYLRAHMGRYLHALSFEPALFNVERQRWEFPYTRTRRELEEIIRKNK